MELKATRPAQYSRSPEARSFQTMTMAMHRASPIRMRPTMYSCCPERKVIARPNMRIGPMIQFWTRDNMSTRVLRNTGPSFSYLTLASGGYIIRMRPMAIGMLVVPTWNKLRTSLMPG